MRILSPSLLSADFLNLGKDIDMLNRSEAEWFHLDIMDGVFVPNISYGFSIVEPVRKATNKLLDVHLMIIEPERYIKRFADAGANFLTIHIEATKEPIKAIEMIKSHGMNSGIAVNPKTPISAVEGVLEYADMILLMSVEPGFGGQKFIPTTLDKIKSLKEMIVKGGYSTLIEVDGGISTDNADIIFEAGADVVVAGKSIFKSDDPIQTIKTICGK